MSFYVEDERLVQQWIVTPGVAFHSDRLHCRFLEQDALLLTPIDERTS